MISACVYVLPPSIRVTDDDQCFFTPFNKPMYLATRSAFVFLAISSHNSRMLLWGKRVPSNLSQRIPGEPSSPSDSSAPAWRGIAVPPLLDWQTFQG